MNKPQASKPQIMILALEQIDMFDAMYDSMSSLIASKAHTKRATTGSSAVAMLFENQLQAVLIVDGGITAVANAAVIPELKTYIERGGIVVFCGLFSSFTDTDSMKSMWQSLNLAWQPGKYQRTDTSPWSPTYPLAHLPGTYSQMALFMTNVDPRTAEWLYTDGYAQMYPSAESQCAAVLSRVGSGKVGYTGDVNAEDETSEVVLRMCGL